MGRKKLKSTFYSLAREEERTNSVVNVKINPLDIPEIVAIVVGNIVKVEDLKTIRALNKQWRDVSMRKWRDSAVFVITKETMRVLAFDDSAFTGIRIRGRAKVLAEIDPLLLREFPFRNYRCQEQEEDELAIASDFEWNLIFQKVIVPHARYLDIGERILSESKGFDRFERIFRYNMTISELALTPLRKDNDYFARGGTFDKEVNRREQLERISFCEPPPKAPTVNQLTLFAPTPGRQKELLEKKGVKPLFVAQGAFLSNQLNYQNIVRWFILKKMPNLKGIHVTSSIAINDILLEMTELSRHGNGVPKLEEIEIPFSENPGSLLGPLIEYIKVVRPPLRKIKAIASWDDCTQGCSFLPVLRFVEENLTDLELEVDCKRRLSASTTSSLAMTEANFYLNGRHFPNLIRFKVVMDYPEGAKGELLSFDLNHLRKMPKLKEFFFGFKNPAKYIPEKVISTKLEISKNPPSWVNKVVEGAPETHGLPEGIYFDPILGEVVEGDGLKNLKSFHLHRNLTKVALQLLGKCAKNLQTLEGIFDEENFPTVRDTWPRLWTLKLLQGSSVPERLFVSKATNELNVVRMESRPSTSAIRKGSLRKMNKKPV